MSRLTTQLRALMGTPAIQTAALCTRPEDGHVLLLTSRDTGRWVLPKGWPMKRQTLAQAALIEAWEEAGVVGTVEDTPLGSFSTLKRLSLGISIPVDIIVHPVRVQHVDDTYPESGQRTRAWHHPHTAASLVDEPELAALLRAQPL